MLTKDVKLQPTNQPTPEKMYFQNYNPHGWGKGNKQWERLTVDVAYPNFHPDKIAWKIAAWWTLRLKSTFTMSSHLRCLPQYVFLCTYPTSGTAANCFYYFISIICFTDSYNALSLSLSGKSAQSAHQRVYKHRMTCASAAHLGAEALIPVIGTCSPFGTRNWHDHASSVKTTFWNSGPRKIR